MSPASVMGGGGASPGQAASSTRPSEQEVRMRLHSINARATARASIDEGVAEGCERSSALHIRMGRVSTPHGGAPTLHPSPCRSQTPRVRCRMLEETLREALTFDDVLLVPGFSEVMPRDVDVSTRLTPMIPLRMPLLSSAMDTVTEAATAIRMAREGGIGFIHKNLSVEDQAREVSRVKKAQSGIVVDPLTIAPSRTLEEALAVMRHYRISGLPVVDADKRPLGILTNRDVRFEKRLSLQVGEMMTKNVVTVKDGVSIDEAKDLLHKHRIEKLLVVDATGKLKGLITTRDIEQAEMNPAAATDEMGRLRVGAAVGVGTDRDARIEALVAAGCDLICIDTAHGHSAGVLQACRDVRKKFPKLQLDGRAHV